MWQAKLLGIWDLEQTDRAQNEPWTPAVHTWARNHLHHPTESPNNQALFAFEIPCVTQKDHFCWKENLYFSEVLLFFKLRLVTNTRRNLQIPRISWGHTDGAVRWYHHKIHPHGDITGSTWWIAVKVPSIGAGKDGQKQFLAIRKHAGWSRYPFQWNHNEPRTFKRSTVSHFPLWIVAKCLPACQCYVKLLYFSKTQLFLTYRCT